MEKIKVKIIGTDGNVFALIGKVSGALKRAGQKKEAQEFTDKAFNAGSYDDVLILIEEYVDVE